MADVGIFKSALDYPRHFDIALYVASIGFATFRLSLDLPPHTWTIPSKNDLVFVEGHFLPSKGGIKAPYEFVTTSGRTLEIGCLPESAMANCIEDARVSLASLSKVTSRVGLFYVRNYRALDLSNVMITLYAGNSAIFAYEDAQLKLQQWSVTEERMHHSALAIGADILLPLPMFLLALWLTLSKRKAAR